MKLIVGLGNPGSQYERTRHNAGFMAIDAFAQKHGAANFRVAHESFLADVILSGEKILLLKPQTYMNLSGRAVASAIHFYKLPTTDLLILVDDTALPAGTIRLRASGSAGGHNGLLDIEAALDTQTYARLRIGIDPPANVPLKDYVLAAFTPSQKPKLQAAIQTAVDAAELWAQNGITAAMNRFNAGSPDGANG